VIKFLRGGKIFHLVRFGRKRHLVRLLHGVPMSKAKVSRLHEAQSSQHGTQSWTGLRNATRINGHCLPDKSWLKPLVAQSRQRHDCLYDLRSTPSADRLTERDTWRNSNKRSAA
jgi:hypothetical protein